MRHWVINLRSLSPRTATRTPQMRLPKRREPSGSVCPVASYQRLPARPFLPFGLVAMRLRDFGQTHASGLNALSLWPEAESMGACLSRAHFSSHHCNAHVGSEKVVGRF